MSLVAYTVESGDESSEEDSSEPITISKSSAIVNNSQSTTNISQINNVNDDDEWFESDGIDTKNQPLIFAQLPLPKPQTQIKELNIEEENDDEFIHKAAEVKNKKVQISIPSLHDFKNLDIKYKDTIRDPDAQPLRRTPAADANKTSKLLSLLPLAKSEQNFMKSTSITPNNKVAANDNKSSAVKKSYFVPDSVRLGRSARNTEGIDEVTVSSHKSALNKTTKKRAHTKHDEESSDENEDSAGDFFSLMQNDATKSDLPDVGPNEINAMLAERSAKIARTADVYLQQQQQYELNEQPVNTKEQTMEVDDTNYESVDLDAEALRTLAGRKAAKRAKHDNEKVQILDIKSNQIMPEREEWMRTALASSTSYQPTGQLTDEEPQAGTRRKHQITYLAHKAKANEAELQAMWAANRQTRRATQSKYGF